jgi:hypothetical protein
MPEMFTLQSGHAAAVADIDSLLQTATRFREAGLIAAEAQIYRQLLAHAPNVADLHDLLGSALQATGHAAQAQDSFRRAIALSPGNARAHVHLGMSLLSQGEYQEGWREYEWRWRIVPEFSNEYDVIPRWQGEIAPGKTLRVWAEQGLGDTLQFCRLTRQASQRGLRVHLRVPPPLRRLLADAVGLGDVIPKNRFHGDFDFQCPMLSLPFALDMAAPGPGMQGSYLRASPARQATWHRVIKECLGNRLRVGIAWAGSATMRLDRRRSLLPELFSALAEVGNAQLVSLQKGGPAAPPQLKLIDLTFGLKDFADTAALIANLDLVVSVDTAVAHLAAAMGKPVWLLDRFDHCWRWLIGSRTTPWYPSMRIVRQSTLGDWTAVIDRVSADLRQVCASRS